MPLAKQKPAGEAGGGRCYKCQARVVWARIRDGQHYRPIAIEPGAGHMAFAPELFAVAGDAPIVMEIHTRTRFRRHDEHCPGPRSFTGQARERKLRWRDAR